MKKRKSLKLARETVRILVERDERAVLGGRNTACPTGSITIVTWDCPAPTDTTH